MDFYMFEGVGYLLIWEIVNVVVILFDDDDVYCCVDLILGDLEVINVLQVV